jgi:hypothetical protein
MRPDERLDAPVVGLLELGREEAAGQFTLGLVEGDAIAADALPHAVVVGAAAISYVLVLNAWPGHGNTTCKSASQGIKVYLVDGEVLRTLRIGE